MLSEPTVHRLRGQLGCHFQKSKVKKDLFGLTKIKGKKSLFHFDSGKSSLWEASVATLQKRYWRLVWHCYPLDFPVFYGTLFEDIAHLEGKLTEFAHIFEEMLSEE